MTKCRLCTLTLVANEQWLCPYHFGQFIQWAMKATKEGLVTGEWWTNAEFEVAIERWLETLDSHSLESHIGLQAVKS
jgi:hypothetical protein